MDYSLLSVEDQLALLRPRLAQLERAHFAATVEAANVADNPTSSGEAAQERVRVIEESIESLRAIEADLVVKSEK